MSFDTHFDDWKNPELKIQDAIRSLEHMTFNGTVLYFWQMGLTDIEVIDLIVKSEDTKNETELTELLSDMKFGDEHYKSTLLTAYFHVLIRTLKKEGKTNLIQKIRSAILDSISWQKGYIGRAEQDTLVNTVASLLSGFKDPMFRQRHSALYSNLSIFRAESQLEAFTQLLLRLNKQEVEQLQFEIETRLEL